MRLCGVQQANASLREALERVRHQLVVAQEEKRELEVAFHRLDHEIATGYDLERRKEKETKIADLTTKNQKVIHCRETPTPHTSWL